MSSQEDVKASNDKLSGSSGGRYQTFVAKLLTSMGLNLMGSLVIQKDILARAIVSIEEGKLQLIMESPRFDMRASVAIPRLLKRSGR